jgi:hypothetical protein
LSGVFSNLASYRLVFRSDRKRTHEIKGQVPQILYIGRHSGIKDTQNCTIYVFN